MSTGALRAGTVPDTHSAVWTGSPKVPARGEYTFYTNGDGVRLSVNGTALINDWNEHSATEDSGKLTLTPGVRVPLRLECYEAFGVGQLRLE